MMTRDENFHRERIYLSEIHGVPQANIVISYNESVGEDVIYIGGKFYGYADLRFDEEMKEYFREKSTNNG